MSRDLVLGKDDDEKVPNASLVFAPGYYRFVSVWDWNPLHYQTRDTLGRLIQFGSPRGGNEGPMSIRP